MKELLDLLEDLDIDFTDIMRVLQSYLVANDVDMTGELVDGVVVDEVIVRDLVFYDYRRDVLVFLETLLQIINSMRKSPMYNDYRVELYRRRVEGLIKRVPVRRDLLFHKFQFIVDYYTEIKILKGLLSEQALLPPQDYPKEKIPRTIHDWINDTEKGMFEV